MALPYPDLRVQSYQDVTPQLLAGRGIRALLLDIDGTLIRTHEDDPPEELLRWIAGLQQAGVKLHILSNSRRGVRARRFAELVNLPCRHFANKPSRKGFWEAAAALGVRPEETAVLGDQIYTDVFGAKRAGMFAIMVESLDTDLWYFPLRRLAELPWRRPR